MVKSYHMEEDRSHRRSSRKIQVCKNSVMGSKESPKPRPDLKLMFLAVCRGYRGILFYSASDRRTRLTAGRKRQFILPNAISQLVGLRHKS